jgi:hypothetical protein
MKFSKFIVAAVVSLLSAVSAHAAVVSALNNTYSFSWNYNGGVDGMLTGNGSMTFIGFGTSSLSTTIWLENTSTPSNSRLTSFGFGIDPNVQSVTFSDASDGGILGAKLGAIPSLATIEVCAASLLTGPSSNQTPNCSGGGNGGILGGSSDTFTLGLTNSGGWGSSVTIDPVGFKYQTAGESYEFTTVTAVPESETYAMMLAGLGLMGTIARRRKNKNA